MDAHEDALQAAILAALRAAEAAREALHAASDSWMPDGRLRRQIAELDRRLDRYHLFSPMTLDRVDAVSRALLQAARGERVTEFIPDEHCMSGTLEHTFLTEHGRAIMRVHLEVSTLAAVLREVRNCLQAEELVVSLRS